MNELSIDSFIGPNIFKMHFVGRFSNDKWQL